MISLSPRPKPRTWRTISFPSTLHLWPILNLLLAEVPTCCQEELRLGLQEALVNAAKHGNCLDPNKVICIRFARINHRCWWIIGDQGRGFLSQGGGGAAPWTRPCSEEQSTPIEAENWSCGPDGVGLGFETEERDCGRGIFLMQHIFDEVRWNREGNELTLCKYLPRSLPLNFLPFWFKVAS